MAIGRKPMSRPAALGLILLLAPGCMSPSWRAQRAAAKMLDPDTSARKSLLYRRRLIELAPHSNQFLADAFFPIGLYDVPEAALPEIAAAGFNLAVSGGRNPSYLARAEALGLRVIPYIPLDYMSREVEKARGERGLLAWYLFDEPDLHRMPPEEYHRLAKKLRRLDPKRPIFLTVWAPRRYADYMEHCDIFAPNPYPITNVEAEKNELRFVALAVDAARAAADGRPVWAILQAFWAEPQWPRNPTPDELGAMVFMALNHGADGVIYFSYKSGDRPITEHAELFDAIKEINGRIRALRGVLLLPPEEDALRQELVEEKAEEPEPVEEPAESEMPSYPPLDCSLRSFRGAKLFIAVNPDPVAKQVRILFPREEAERHASELFGAESTDPVIIPPGAPLTLSFEPHQTRLFWIE